MDRMCMACSVCLCYDSKVDFDGCMIHRTTLHAQSVHAHVHTNEWHTDTPPHNTQPDTDTTKSTCDGRLSHKHTRTQIHVRVAVHDAHTSMDSTPHTTFYRTILDGRTNGRTDDDGDCDDDEDWQTSNLYALLGMTRDVCVRVYFVLFCDFFVVAVYLFMFFFSSFLSISFWFFFIHSHFHSLSYHILLFIRCICSKRLHTLHLCHSFGVHCPLVWQAGRLADWLTG